MPQSTQGSVLRREQWMFLLFSHTNIHGSRIKIRQIFYRIVSTIFCKQSCHHIPSFPLMYRTTSSYWDTTRTFPSPKSGNASSLQIPTSPGLHNPHTPHIPPAHPQNPIHTVSSPSQVPSWWIYQEAEEASMPSAQTHSVPPGQEEWVSFHAKANRWSLLFISRNKFLGIWVILSVSLKLASRQKHF